MSLLSRHVSQLKSEEFVLGVSAGWRGDEKDPNMQGKESTKLLIVAAAPNAKTWTGFKAVEQSLADASVGEKMVGRSFPARCLVTYNRVSAVQKTMFEGKTIEKDIEKLVVTAIEYISQVDLVDIKLAKAA